MQSARRPLWLGLFLVLLAAVATGGADITGLVYHDGDHSSRSYYEQGLDEFDAPLPDIDVYLLDGTEEQSTITGGDGDWSFTGLAPGTYLVDVGVEAEYECTSANRPLRVPAAVREGAIHIASIGDSIGVFGSDQPYPERLAAYFAEMVDVTLSNVAVGGSTSWQWLPGAEEAYFEDRLLPVLPDIDVLTYTIGGNDLGWYAHGMPPYDPWEIVRRFFEHPEYLLGILPNIGEIIEAVREVNPDCDFVYVIYPNFARSVAWQDLLGEFMRGLTEFGIDIGLPLARWAVGTADPIVLADMYAAHGDDWIDDYLIDVIHPNDLGHQFYADVIFMSLGGVVIEPSEMGEEHLIGYDAPDLVPADDDTLDDDTLDDDTIDDDTLDDDTIDDDAIDDDVVDDDAIDDDADDDMANDDAADDDADDDTSSEASAEEDDDDGCGC